MPQTERALPSEGAQDGGKGGQAQRKLPVGGSGSAQAIRAARVCMASAWGCACFGSKQKCFIMELWWPRTLRGSIGSPRASNPTRTPHSLSHSQEDVGVMLTLLQGINTLGFPLGPCLKEDGFRPQDTCNPDTRTHNSDPTSAFRNGLSICRLPREGLAKILNRGPQTVAMTSHVCPQGLRRESHKGSLAPPARPTVALMAQAGPLSRGDWVGRT